MGAHRLAYGMFDRLRVLQRLLLGVSLAFGFVAFAPARAAQPLFAPAGTSPVSVGKGSGRIVLADVNGDRHLDLVTQHLLQQKIVVMHGDGRGAFSTASDGSMSLDYQPGNIALADIDQDGVLDMAVASRDENREFIHLYVGKSEGRFEKFSDSTLAVAAAIKTYKPSIDFVDLDRDGDLDIVYANRRRNTIEVFVGDGRAHFDVGPASERDGGDNFTFALGDVNHDGNTDVVAVVSGMEGQPGQLFGMLGDGHGRFKKGTTAGATLPPHSRMAALADMNEDGWPDAVLVHDADRLSVYENDKRGRFKASPGYPLRLELPAHGVAAADLNRDGKTDLLAATVNRQSPFSAKVEVLLGNGKGLAHDAGSPYAAEPGAYNVAVGDMNEDGKPDIAASSFEGSGVTVLLAR